MIKSVRWSVVLTSLSFAWCAPSHADGACARALRIPFDGVPGRSNVITDVECAMVGYDALIRDDGEYAVCTGVTAILPRGKTSNDRPVFAGMFSLNGNGEMTGTHWIEESGILEGPVMLTNTHSVGVVRDATIQWRIHHGAADVSGYWWSLPAAAAIDHQKLVALLKERKVIVHRKATR